MISKVSSAVLVGVEAREVSVEARAFGSKDAFSLAGLPDASVREARHSVKSALAQVGTYVSQTVVVHLGPADLPALRVSPSLPPWEDIIICPAEGRER